MSTDPYAGPAIVELMGHRRLAGIVSHAEMYGVAMLRIDVPGPEGTTTTQFYGGGSIYALTPTTTDVVRAVAANNQPAVVHPWELPAPLKADGADAHPYDYDPARDCCRTCGGNDAWADEHTDDDGHPL